MTLTQRNAMYQILMQVSDEQLFEVQQAVADNSEQRMALERIRRDIRAQARALIGTERPAMTNTPVPSSTTLTTLDDLRDVLALDPGQDNPEISSELAGRYGLPNAHGVLDWTELPTFGGEAPADTQGVWSWDATRLLVGTCASDLRIVARA